MVAMIGRRAFALTPVAFQCLARFANECAIDQAYPSFASQWSRADFVQRVERLAEQGFLVRADGVPTAEPGLGFPTTLEDALDPTVAALLPQMAEPIGRHRAVVIRHAFRPQLAEQVFAALDGNEHWTSNEDLVAVPHYRHHMLAADEHAPAVLRACRAMFDSPRTKALASSLCGLACTGPLELGGTRYLPGDFAMPHADAKHGRTLAFIWYLSRDWQASWGGHFIWCQNGVHLVPTFNTLVVFAVATQTVHAVTPVSPYAVGKRLAVTGWWSGAAAEEPTSVSNRGRWGLAAASYGDAPQAIDERAGVFAL